MGQCLIESFAMSDSPTDSPVDAPIDAEKLPPERAQSPTGAAPELQPQAAPGGAATGRSGFGALVLGGAVAAALGFALAQVVPLSGGAPAISGGVSAGDLAAIKSDLADLRASVAAAPPTDTSGLTARLDAMESRLSGLAAPDLSAVEGRIAALEARPLGSLSAADAAALAGLQSEVAALKSGGISQAQVDAANAALQAKLDEAMAAATAMQTNAADTAAKAAQRGAVLQIGAALDSGAPYSSAIKALEGVNVPEALVANAAGLPSLKSLQDGFPPAARTALDAALKADMGAGWTDRALSFLRTQVGARSLSARDGTDPDAILSRAEAALSAGDVPAALSELDALPEIAKTAMAQWRLGADQRQAAQAALATLTQELGL